MDRTKIKRALKYGLGGVAALLLIAQVVPVDRTNPPVESEIDAPPEVLSVLQRSCYDCHSNETAWPWYSRVAPASWLVAKDVREGREDLNFSVWGRYTAEERAEKLEETWEEVAEGEMPLKPYTLMHPGTRLSAADREVLRTWALAATHLTPAADETRHEESGAPAGSY